MLRIKGHKTYLLVAIAFAFAWTAFYIIMDTNENVRRPVVNTLGDIAIGYWFIFFATLLVVVIIALLKKD
jgi:hypothetical protein